MTQNWLDMLFATDCVYHVMLCHSLDWKPHREYIVNHPLSPSTGIEKTLEKAEERARHKTMIQFYKHFENLEKNRYTFRLLAKKHQHLFTNTTYTDMSLLFYCVEISIFAMLAYIRNVKFAPYIAIRNICQVIEHHRGNGTFNDFTYLTWRNLSRNPEFHFPHPN